MSRAPSLVSILALSACAPEPPAPGPEAPRGGALERACWYWRDADADGYGDPGFRVRTPGCALPAGHARNPFDCDDGAGQVNPSAVETCNDVDDDCDGHVDLYAVDEQVWFRDADGDGWGRYAQTWLDCDRPDGYAADFGDCAPADPARHPGAAEVCDGADDDCDGLDDDDDPDTLDRSWWYDDLDLDGHGDAGSATLACGVPGAVAVADDCDDADPTRHPGAADVPGDGLDQDCDGGDAPTCAALAPSPADVAAVAGASDLAFAADCSAWVATVVDGPDRAVRVTSAGVVEALPGHADEDLSSLAVRADGSVVGGYAAADVGLGFEAGGALGWLPLGPGYLTSGSGFDDGVLAFPWAAEAPTSIAVDPEDRVWVPDVHGHDALGYGGYGFVSGFLATDPSDVEVLSVGAERVESVAVVEPCGDLLITQGTRLYRVDRATGVATLLFSAPPYARLLDVVADGDVVYALDEDAAVWRLEGGSAELFGSGFTRAKLAISPLRDLWVLQAGPNGAAAAATLPLPVTPPTATCAILPCADCDLDLDGLLDVEEPAHGAMPGAADTDGDGLLDGQEVALGCSPAEVDTDDDGIPDPSDATCAGDPPPGSLGAWSAATSVGGYAYATVAIGDVDGDGFGDVVVGDDVNEALDVWLGGPTGLSAAPLTLGPPAGAAPGFGSALAVGDLDGDGQAEIAVGTSGALYLRWGVVAGPGALDDAPLTTITGFVAYPPYDPVAFLALDGGPGAALVLHDRAGVGAVSVFRAAELPVGAAVPLAGASLRLTGGPTNSLFGLFFAAVGDVRGGPAADLVVGDPYADLQAGGVWLFADVGGASGTLDPAAAEASWTADGTLFASSVDALGDVTGDGDADVFVSQAGSDGHLLDDLRTHTSGPSSSARAPADYLAGGRGVDLLGGDGVPEILLDRSPSGPPVLLLSNPGDPLGASWYELADTAEALHVATGDVNGDGLPDVVITENGAAAFGFDLYLGRP